MEELLVYVVSWVGISVAVVCLATCLTTLCCQGAPWHTDHSTIHCNLWANLLVTELLFLVGANKTQYTVSASVSDRRKQTVIVKVQPEWMLPLVCVCVFQWPGCVLHHRRPAALLAALGVLLAVSGGVGALPVAAGGLRGAELQEEVLLPVRLLHPRAGGGRVGGHRLQRLQLQNGVS